MSKYEKAFEYLVGLYYANKGINPTKKELYDFKQELMKKIEERNGKNK